MAQVSEDGSKPLVILLIGALALVVVVVCWFLYSSAQSAADARPPAGVDFSLPKSPLPDGPKMPSPPIPKPVG